MWQTSLPSAHLQDHSLLLTPWPCDRTIIFHQWSSWQCPFWQYTFLKCADFFRVTEPLRLFDKPVWLWVIWCKMWSLSAKFYPSPKYQIAFPLSTFRPCRIVPVVMESHRFCISMAAQYDQCLDLIDKPWHWAFRSVYSVHSQKSSATWWEETQRFRLQVSCILAKLICTPIVHMRYTTCQMQRLFSYSDEMVSYSLDLCKTLQAAWIVSCFIRV